MNLDNLLKKREEFTPEARAAMREKFRKRDPKTEGYAHLSNEAAAGHVYWTFREDLDFGAMVELGRNRIMHLSLEVETLRTAVHHLHEELDRKSGAVVDIGDRRYECHPDIKAEVERLKAELESIKKCSCTIQTKDL